MAPGGASPPISSMFEMLATIATQVTKAFSLKGLVSLNSLLILLLSGWAAFHEGDRIRSHEQQLRIEETTGRIEEQSQKRDEEIIRRLERIEDDLQDLKTHLIPTPS